MYTHACTYVYCSYYGARIWIYNVHVYMYMYMYRLAACNESVHEYKRTLGMVVVDENCVGENAHLLTMAMYTAHVDVYMYMYVDSGQCRGFSKKTSGENRAGVEQELNLLSLAYRATTPSHRGSSVGMCST